MKFVHTEQWLPSACAIIKYLFKELFTSEAMNDLRQGGTYYIIIHTIIRSRYIGYSKNY
jgi:hypothetical protein